MNIDIYEGDCIEQLKRLADQSINTCITSPPYWGLRNYQEDKQLGMEDTPEEFISNLVDVFREVIPLFAKAYQSNSFVEKLEGLVTEPIFRKR